jgi:hypothetical protein
LLAVHTVEEIRQYRCNNLDGNVGHFAIYNIPVKGGA